MALAGVKVAIPALVGLAGEFRVEADIHRVPASQLQQFLNCHAGSGKVVRAHPGDASVFEEAVKDHDGRAVGDMAPDI